MTPHESALVLLSLFLMAAFAARLYQHADARRTQEATARLRHHLDWTRPRTRRRREAGNPLARVWRSLR